MEHLYFLSEREDLVYFIMAAIFLGAVLIGNVPAILHTPLMSGANAISGIILIGAISLVSITHPENTTGLVLGWIAVAAGSINIVGGFAVTDRMLKMFKSKK